MRHLVIGLGSIGSRHKRLLEEAGETVIGVDKSETIKWDCDMVWICSPNDTHLMFIEEAIIRQIPRIFVEKPMVLTMDEADKIKHWPGIAGCRIWVAQNMRFHPGAMAIKENLGKAGKIRYARLWFQHSIKNQRKDWREYMGKTNIVMDCIQWIDLALWLFGARDNKIKEHPEPIIWREIVAKLWVIPSSGVITFIDLDFLRQDKSCGIEVIGEEGTLLWHSTGKNPEHCLVSFRNAGGNTPMIDDILYPNEATYRPQLDYLLKDQWQSNIDDTIASLEVALG